MREAYRRYFDKQFEGNMTEHMLEQKAYPIVRVTTLFEDKEYDIVAINRISFVNGLYDTFYTSIRSVEANETVGSHPIAQDGEVCICVTQEGGDQ
jgi:hypothetical protein